MMPVVIVSDKTMDSILSTVVVARGSSDLFDIRFYDDDELPGFFDRKTQRGLPEKYKLILIGMKPRRRSVSGVLIRPKLVDGLRSFSKPVEWFSNDEWHSEDVAAIGHIIGEVNLHIDSTADDCISVAATVFGRNDDLERQLAKIIKEPGAGPGWSGDWLKTLNAFRMKPTLLLQVVDLLIHGEPESLDEETISKAEDILRGNTQLVASGTEHILLDRERLGYLSVPFERFVFRRDIGAMVRKQADAAYSLVCFPERAFALLSALPAKVRQVSDLAGYAADSLQSLTVEDDAPDTKSLIFTSQSDFSLRFRDLLEAFEAGRHILRE